MDENLCPVCGRLTLICGTEEYIELDPNDITKAVKKTVFHRACTNPQCTNFAGNPAQPTITVSFNYQKGDEVVVEKDIRPNVDLGNVQKIASTTVYEAVLPVKTDIKVFAESVVLNYSAEDAMVLATKLSEKVVSGDAQSA